METDFNADSAPEHLSKYNDIYSQPRSLSLAHLQVGEWRNQEKTRTSFGIITVCLNIGTDPPDFYRPEDAPIIEAGIDPFKVSDEFVPKSNQDRSNNPEDNKGKPIKIKSPLERIGNNLQMFYNDLSKTTHFRVALDPAYEDFKRLVTHVRQEIKDDRMLFHYNGHGVPKPSAGGDIWVFNKSFSQYIPLSAIELSTWVGCPALYVWDISNSESVIMAFEAAAEIKAKETEILYNKRKQAQLNSADPESKKYYEKNPMPNFLSLYKNEIHLGATKRFEELPLNPGIPSDLFTACLTNPIETALKFHVMRKGGFMKQFFDSGFKIPGTPRERRTPLGELTWIFTSITDTIAWDILPRDLFRQLFRQDVMVASLCRNFILSDRIMRYYGCHPVSYPKFPPTHLHTQWETWDLEVDSCVQQFIRSAQSFVADHRSPLDFKQIALKINLDKHKYDHSKYFLNQLDAFDLWLHHAKSIVVSHLSAVNSLSTKDSETEVDGRRAGGIRSLSLGAPSGLEPPLELPVVLQVLLSQNYRHNALALLYSFLILGPWAVDLAYAIGISPFIVKLLGSATNEITGLLILVWAKLVAGDPDCSKELLKNDGYRYFINYLGQSSAEAERFYHDIRQSEFISSQKSNDPNVEISSSLDESQPELNSEAKVRLLKDMKTLNVVSTAACFVLCMFCKLGKSAQAAVFKDETLNYIYTHLTRPDDETTELAQLKVWAILTLSAVLDNYLEAQWMAITYRECVINAKKDSLLSAYLKNTRFNSSHIEYSNISDINDPYLKEKIEEIETETSVKDISELLIPLAFHKEQRVRSASIHAIGSLLKGLRVLSEGKVSEPDEFIDILVDMKFSNYWESLSNEDSNSLEELENSFKNFSSVSHNKNYTENLVNIKVKGKDPVNHATSKPNSSNPNKKNNTSYNFKVAQKARSTEIMLWEAVLSASQDGSPMVRKEVVNIIGSSIIHSYIVEFIRAISVVSAKETGSDISYIYNHLEKNASSSKNSPENIICPLLVTNYMVKFYKALLVLSSDPHLDVMQSSMRLIDLLFQAYTHSCYFILTPQINLSNHIHTWATKTSLSGFAPPTLSLKTLKNTKSLNSTVGKKINSTNDQLHKGLQTNKILAEGNPKNLDSAINNRFANKEYSPKVNNFSKNSEYKNLNKLQDPKNSLNQGIYSDVGKTKILNISPEAIKTDGNSNLSTSSRDYTLDHPHSSKILRKKAKLKGNTLKLQDSWVEYARKQLEANFSLSQIYDWEGAYILESDLVLSISTETNSEFLIKSERKKIQSEFIEISSFNRKNKFNEKFSNKEEILPPNLIPGPTCTVFHPISPHLIVATHSGDINVIDYSTKSIISRYDIINSSSEIFSPVKDLHLVNPESRTLLLNVYDDGVVRIFNSYAPTLSVNDSEQHQRQLTSNNFDIKGLKFPVPELITTFRAINSATPNKNNINSFLGANPSQKKTLRSNSLSRHFSGGPQNSSYHLPEENVFGQSTGCGVVSDFCQQTGNLFVGSKNSQNISVWDLNSEQMVSNISSKFFFSSVSSISVEKYGNLVVVGNTDGVVRMHDLRLPPNSSPVQSWRDLYPNQIQSSFFMDLNDTNIYSASILGTVFVWDIRNKASILNFETIKHREYDLSLNRMVNQKYSTFFATSSNYTVEAYNSKGDNLGSFNSLPDSTFSSSESLFSSFKTNFNIFGASSTHNSDTITSTITEDSDNTYSPIKSSTPIGYSMQLDTLAYNPTINSLNLSTMTNPYSKILGNSAYLSSVDSLRVLGMKYDLMEFSANSEKNSLDGLLSITENLGLLSSYGNRTNGSYKQTVDINSSIPVNLVSGNIKISDSAVNDSHNPNIENRLNVGSFKKPDMGSNNININRRSAGLTPPPMGKTIHRSNSGLSSISNHKKPNSYNQLPMNSGGYADVSKDMFEFVASMDDSSINHISFHPYLPKICIAQEDGSIYTLSN
ncbi:WD repeat-containing protein mip1 [Smittium culicis]|uniref:WD repeat-containing protein mip1 n=2 Tax=Smittium culicis TaxID=133412 RepID=A0A1R1Y2J2_9FUNG|nr:WD repeat-containing protein mip1 [Smittium culicis]